ncbi:MAG: DNA-formamidopyrimidine glycosylase [Turicibacter sp.]
MPELPEVETVKKALNTQIIGLKISAIEVLYEPMIKNIDLETFKQKLIHQTIKHLSRRGKYLIFHFDEGYLVSHLRMEGRYYYTDEMFELNPHVHCIFKLNNGMQLLYQDTRKFGTFHYYETEEDLEVAPPLLKLGVEPNSFDFNEAYLKEKLKNKKKPIKSLLLDQSVVAGLGNIYVDEVLFRANIHPEKVSQNLSDEEIKNVIKYTVKVLGRAVELGGTTIRTYRSQHGVSGQYQHELCVHQKANEPCTVCGTEITKIKVGGRGTYFCEVCQPRN